MLGAALVLARDHQPGVEFTFLTFVIGCTSCESKDQLKVLDPLNQAIIFLSQRVPKRCYCTKMDMSENIDPRERLIEMESDKLDSDLNWSIRGYKFDVEFVGPVRHFQSKSTRANLRLEWHEIRARTIWNIMDYARDKRLTERETRTLLRQAHLEAIGKIKSSIKYFQRSSDYRRAKKECDKFIETSLRRYAKRVTQIQKSGKKPNGY